MNDPFTVMTTPPPAVSEKAAAALLDTRYGIGGKLKRLDSERDQNFLVRAESGDSFVLKIANSAESFAVTDFQMQALLHIERMDPGFPAPRVAESLDGEISTTIDSGDGRTHTVRVLTWLSGQPLFDVEPRPDVAGQLGRFLARLGLALKAFEHPASDYHLLWDLKRAAALTPLLDKVADEELRSICRGLLQDFARIVEPALPGLRWQVIYNDLHASNVLVGRRDPSRFAGIIDFGDLVRAPLINDVAVAAAYLCREGDAALADILKFLEAYHRLTPLEERELELLYHLLLMRNCMTVLIASWRADRYPENRDYILQDAARARRTIASLTHLGYAKITSEFRTACA